MFFQTGCCVLHLIWTESVPKKSESVPETSEPVPEKLLLKETISAAAQHAERMQMPTSQRHYQRPAPSDSIDGYYSVPQPRQRSQPSAWQHPYPSNSGMRTQPGVSGTVPQNPAPSQQEEVMLGLPSRHMGGK